MEGGWAAEAGGDGSQHSGQVSAAESPQSNKGEEMCVELSGLSSPSNGCYSPKPESRTTLGQASPDRSMERLLHAARPSSPMRQHPIFLLQQQQQEEEAAAGEQEVAVPAGGEAAVPAHDAQ